MISAKMTTTYVSPSGRFFNVRPDCIEVQTGWKKEWLLAVHIDGGRYFSGHKESLANGLAEDPEFNEHIKRVLVKNIGNMIADVISNQI